MKIRGFYLVLRLPFDTVLVLRECFPTAEDANVWAGKNFPAFDFNIEPGSAVKKIGKKIWVPFKRK
jgi:hypothetical protein